MKILNLDNWCEEAEGILEGYWQKTNGADHREEVVGIVARLNSALDREYLQVFPNLRFIASCTTGLDHIDLDYCKKKSIEVISLQGDPILEDVWATAEHTWALILSLIRKVPFAHNDVCAGNWDRERWQGTELRGKTLGIVGYGRVGRQVARIAEGFGMDVVIYDVAPDDYRRMYDCVKYVRFDEVLQNADILTVHLPLNDETRSMFGAKEFAIMKPTAYFVNTSRGGVVDEKALLNALGHKRIAGAALDVVQGEQHPDFLSGLYSYAAERDNLIITPHLGGNTLESRKKTQIHIARRILEFIGGGTG